TLYVTITLALIIISLVPSALSLVSFDVFYLEMIGYIVCVVKIDQSMVLLEMIYILFFSKLCEIIFINEIISWKSGLTQTLLGLQRDILEQKIWKFTFFTSFKIKSCRMICLLTFLRFAINCRH
ncbi:Protein U90, partial [Frankliniella fusca]